MKNEQEIRLSFKALEECKTINDLVRLENGFDTLIRENKEELERGFSALNSDLGLFPSE